ncbi:MAG: murein biosynthesis integral membrane protein MurJ [Deltaproteobacteria bacterium]|nr:murein biosynthesis integral membrane protein MurJ [Deltaproteobacteria bacterium]
MNSSNDTNAPSGNKSDISQVSSRAGLVGFLTFISRFFGLARDSFIAYLLGTKEAADAFYVAFRIPNLLRRLLAEGNLTISFVPIFTEALRKDPEEAKKVASYTFTLLSCLLLGITVLGVVFASSFVSFTAMGFRSDPDKFHLTVLLTRITFPYIFLVSIGALAMGILNSLKRFGAPAAAPIFMNLGIILAALVLGKVVAHPSISLAIGVLLGGVLQIAVQVPTLYRLGFLPRVAWNPGNDYVRRIFKLMLPAIYGSAVYQLNILAITFMASFLGTGAVSYLWYADRVMEFPLGVFAISFATVILPQLSEHAADKNPEQFKSTFLSGLRMIYFINIPAMLGLLCLSNLIISVLFQHGHFNADSTRQTAHALMGFAIGLPFVSGTRITASAFYALQDSKSPVRAANWAVLVNIGVGALLVNFFGHVGLALGVSSGSVFNFFAHIYDFQKKNGRLGFAQAWPTILKIICAALVMALVLISVEYFTWGLIFKNKFSKLLSLILLMGLGTFTYAVAAYLLKIEEFEVFKGIVKRRLGRV